MATVSYIPFEAKLIDRHNRKKTLSVLVEAPVEGSSLLIRPEGMGDLISKKGNGYPIVLELYEGKFLLHVWSDINKEDPTHTIDLSGALESNRLERE